MDIRRWRNRVRTVVLTGILALATVPAAAQPQRGALPPSPPVQSGDYTLDAEVKPRRVQPNAEVTIQAEVTASEARQNQLVDVEIYDAQNRRVAQHAYTGQSFAPGQTRTFQWRWRAPADLPPGDYTVKLGVFSANWQQLLAWDNMAALFRVRNDRAGAPPTQAVDYDLDGRVRPRDVKPGHDVRIETSVTASQAAQNQRVDVAILDANDRKVAQHVYNDQSFAAGQTQRYEWRWRVPAELAAGTYTVKVAVIDPDRRQRVDSEDVVASLLVNAPTANLATLTSPAPGSPLPGPTVTFNWTPGTSVSEYWLHMGTAAGKTDILSTGETNRSRTVTGLPTDRPIHVRLWSKIGDTWHYTDHTYAAARATASGPAPTISDLAHVRSPAPGSRLPGPTVTFTWSPGTGVSEYRLDVGSAPGKADILTTGEKNHFRTVTGLPTDGRTVHVRLWSKIGQTWHYTDHAYTAGTLSGAR